MIRASAPEDDQHIDLARFHVAGEHCQRFDAGPSDIGRTIDGSKQPGQRCQGKNGPKNAQHRKGIGARMKDLRHQQHSLLANRQAPVTLSVSRRLGHGVFL
jgi:hypothetical protein